MKFENLRISVQNMSYYLVDSGCQRIKR